jgi:TetR/AcrR family transcriptional regulator, regulator of mycofactocin system
MDGMTGAKGRSGRPATTSHEQIAATAVSLFERQGYAETSVAEIAAAVGIARRTFFAYFASKTDAFWWRDEHDLRTVERALASLPAGAAHPLQEIIDIALASPSWAHPTKEETRARHAMLESNPELQIGALRFHRRWSALIADHLRGRIGPTVPDLLPEVIAAALLGVAETVSVRWAYGDDERPLRVLFDENIAIVRAAFEETVAAQLLH